MEYAITDPFGNIYRVSQEPAPGATPISAEAAALVAAGREARPPQRYAIHEGRVRPWEEIVAARRAALVAARPRPPRSATKLALMRRLSALGKWQKFKNVLKSMPEEVQEAWDLAQVIDESDPLFSANRAAIAAALGLSEAQVGALFAP